MTTTALAMTGMTDAEKTTALHPGERLKFPWLAVLSKAAYVVLWRELPDGDSHYGSRGIIVLTFFNVLHPRHRSLRGKRHAQTLACSQHLRGRNGPVG